MTAALPALKIVYRALPKAACSSVKAGLALIDPDQNLTLEQIQQDQDLVHGVYQTSRFRADHWENYTGWWRFTVVRDPLKRLFSAYTDRVIKRRNLHDSRQIRSGKFDLPTDPDADFFFQNLPDYMRASSVIKHHVLPTHMFIGPKPLDYDRVYPVEDIAGLEAELSERVGQPFQVPRFNTSSARLSYFDLQPATQAAIREYLAPDYDLLDNYYQPPW